VAFQSAAIRDYWHWYQIFSSITDADVVRNYQSLKVRSCSQGLPEAECFAPLDSSNLKKSSIEDEDNVYLWNIDMIQNGFFEQRQSSRFHGLLVTDYEDEMFSEP